METWLRLTGEILFKLGTPGYKASGLVAPVSALFFVLFFHLVDALHPSQ